MHLDSCEDWKELLYDTTIPQNSPRSVYATVTTHQYLLIGANGSIEIHQAIDEVYLKVEPELYRENKYESLILSMPGFDAKDVWGNETPAREYFSENNKTGLVYRKRKYI